MKILINPVIALLFFMLCGSAYAEHSFSRDNVTVSHPWSRPTPPGVPMGVGYMAISNQGDTGITLIGATTPKANKVTIHESSMKEGMMTMRRLKNGLTIPAGETVQLEPHGYHLMLEGLKGAVARDERIPMTLNFDGAGSLQIELGTMPMGEGAMDGQGMDHQ